MAVTRITKRTVDTVHCPPGKRNVCLWDDTVKGFGLVITSNGARTYVVQYRIGGRDAKTRRYTIGRHGSPWTPHTARERALDILQLVRTGVDPIDSERDARRMSDEDDEDRAYFDFDAFADRFIEKHVKANALRSLKDIQGTFDRDLRPWFRGKSVRRIVKADVKAMLSHVADRSQSAANKAHKWLNRMFTWGIKHDRLEDSPMNNLTKPFPEPKRDRVLDRSEIRTLVAAVPKLARVFEAMVLMLLLTGQRLREVAGIRWEEIDLERDEWIIPASRTKNKLRHLVPITRQMRSILMELSGGRTDLRGLVLTTNGRTPISGFSKAKEALDAAIDGLAGPGVVPGWVYHDLRRTLSTGCGELRIRIEYAEAVLNHVSGTKGGVAGTYNLYQYRTEKQEALEAWADHLERVVGRPLRLAPGRS